MKSINRIKAFLNLDNSKAEIGDMVLDKNKVYFKYNQDFIESGLQISPFKLKLSNEILSPNVMHFDGLFGVFSDSIPDGWGKLLLDRKLIAQGININQISALDRLTFLDQNSLGAISYEPELENNFNFNKNIDLDNVSNEIIDIQKGISIDEIEEMFLLGGSSGGARPKIHIGYNPKTNQIIHSNSILLENFEHWIIKFPASNDFDDIAKIEFTYNLMARNAGIEVADFKLFKTQKGKYFFGSKRFDRIGNQKLHLHSVAGLLHDNFRMSTLDYGHIMECGFNLEKSVSVYDKILRLAAFNFLAHNRDDHSKNFSFLMDKNGIWKFAPAYDLTFSNSSFGLHSTGISGEYKNPTLKHLQLLAKHFNVKKPNLIFDEVANSINQFSVLANNIEVNKETINLIERDINRM
jgi:serine/threonine-protein kinase HipA